MGTEDRVQNAEVGVGGYSGGLVVVASKIMLHMGEWEASHMCMCCVIM